MNKNLTVISDKTEKKKKLVKLINRERVNEYHRENVLPATLKTLNMWNKYS